MSKSIKILLGLGLATFVSACAQQAPQEEVILVDPAPIDSGPVFTGKYK